LAPLGSLPVEMIDFQVNGEETLIVVTDTTTAAEKITVLTRKVYSTHSHG